MPTAVEILRANGLAMPEPVVQAAADVGLDLPSGAAIAYKESRARNVFGHDKVDTGGVYAYGDPVTVERYWAYRRSPTAGWQGIGLDQLTYKGYIVQAEKMNPAAGAADPLTNCRVGFQALRDLQRQLGPQDGARAYNGTNAAAQEYGRDFIRVRDWLAGLLPGAKVPPPIVAVPPGPHDGPLLPELHEGDRSELVFRLAAFLNTKFPAYSHIDNGSMPPSRVGPTFIAAATEFQRRVGISTAAPFGWGARSWAEARRLGFS